MDWWWPCPGLVMGLSLGLAGIGLIPALVVAALSVGAGASGPTVVKHTEPVLNDLLGSNSSKASETSKPISQSTQDHQAAPIEQNINSSSATNEKIETKAAMTQDDDNLDQTNIDEKLAQQLQIKEDEKAAQDLQNEADAQAAQKLQEQADAESARALQHEENQRLEKKLKKHIDIRLQDDNINLKVSFLQIKWQKLSVFNPTQGKAEKLKKNQTVDLRKTSNVKNKPSNGQS